MSEDTGGHRVPLGLCLISIVALWSCYFVVATLRGWAMDLPWTGEILAYRLLITLLSIAIFAVLIPVFRLLDSRSPAQRTLFVIVLALPVSLALAVVNYAIFDSIESAVYKHDEKGKVVRIRGEDGATYEQDDQARTVRIRSEDGANVLIEMPPAPPAPPVPPAPPELREEAVPPVPPAPPEAPGLREEAVPGVQADTSIEKGANSIRITTGRNAEMRKEKFQAIADIAFGRYFLVLAWAAIYFALAKGEEARLAERREGEYRRAAANAEVRSLRYQVNPHFLFNTLNSLSALVMTGKPERAEEMIQTLSTYYRRTLSSDPTGDVTLADEIALQQLYLEIEAVRFPDRLRNRIEISPEVSQALVPGMILQPVIENSVKYAVAACHTPVTIDITAREVHDKLVVTIGDDGPMTGTGDPHGCGIGLGNVRDRLRARFGDAASLSFGPRAGGGFETVLTMPLQQRGA